VAQWAQFLSVIELVAGVALTGVGAGLSVLVAQSPSERRPALLRAALRLGALAALPVALAIAALAPQYWAACAAGWLSIVAGMVNAYWLGHEQRGRMLALAAAGALLALLAGLAAPQGRTLEALAVAYAVPSLVLLAGRRAPRAEVLENQALRRYLLPGLAIGILSPASLLAARELVAQALSWHAAGELQALWRASDWIAAPAWGVLSILYLPRLAAAHRESRLPAVVQAALVRVVLPCAVLLGLLYLVHRPLLALLYDPSFALSDSAAALVLGGTLLRIASWVGLAALYAMRRTRAIALGELLSLPLFAALLALSAGRLTLELAGALWLLSFAAYCAFNFWAMRRA
jgi:O-antigen/teichoic acid export membrane protein